ncbi:hypothetical protein PLEI_0266 [Photobacterium leiognathi lrivu.4.1]|uniref:Uncharacterized protein n=1 Tax=Photobacterium leiognathi lrivu.4.1 TaxID=1248232 RepID=V5F1F9_PHOLE|nr:hypothetical protein PLEI_0266 [Photobacterium leiognathi lrivu.4.1]
MNESIALLVLLENNINIEETIYEDGSLPHKSLTFIIA